MVLSTRKTTKTAAMRKKINEENYQKIFGKNGALTEFIHTLHALTENMEKYDDINDRPLKTLENMVIGIVEFRRGYSKKIDYLKKHVDQDKHKRLQSLAVITKEWFLTNGISYNAGSIEKDRKIGDFVTIRFHDRNVLRLGEFENEIKKFKNSQVKHGLNPADRVLDEEVSIAYYKLKPMVNQIRFTMTSMVSELKKLQHAPKKRFSLFR